MTHVCVISFLAKGVILPDNMALDVEADHFRGIGNGLGNPFNSGFNTATEAEEPAELTDKVDGVVELVEGSRFSLALRWASSTMSLTPETYDHYAYAKYRIIMHIM